jgi:hypothetical protein
MLRNNCAMVLLPIAYSSMRRARLYDPAMRAVPV